MRRRRLHAIEAAQHVLGVSEGGTHVESTTGATAQLAARGPLHTVTLTPVGPYRDGGDSRSF